MGAGVFQYGKMVAVPFLVVGNYCCVGTERIGDDILMSEDAWKREAIFLRGMLAKSFESYERVMRDLIKAHADIIQLVEEGKEASNECTVQEEGSEG